MARDFNGSNQYMSVVAAPVAGYPLSLSCWISSDGIGTALSVSDLDTADHHDSIVIANATTIWAISSAGTSSASDNTGWSHATWHHACAVFASSTSRIMYVDGVAAPTDTASKTPNARDKVGVGARMDGSPNTLFDGRLAECAIWNIALSAGNVTSLAGGALADSVAAANLVAYWPLCGLSNPEPDVDSGNNLAFTGAPAASGHPFTNATHCGGGGGGGGEASNLTLLGVG